MNKAMVRTLLTSGDIDLMKDITEEEFFTRLEQMEGHFVCVHIIGSVCILQQFENFEFHDYEDKSSGDYCIRYGDLDSEGLDYNLVIDSVEKFKTSILDLNSVTAITEDGLTIHFSLEEVE